MAVFDKAQATAIVAYLEFKRDADEFNQSMVDEALANYWRQRVIGEVV